MKRKLTTTLAVSFLAVGCVVGGVFAVNNVETANAASQLEYLSSFEMKAGAAVRLKDPNGIRFTTTISKENWDTLNTMVAEGEIESFELGTLVCPVYANDDDVLDMSDVKEGGAKKIVRKTWDEDANPSVEGATTYEYNADLIGIQAHNITEDFMAVGYCTINGTTHYYATNADATVMSPMYAATALAETYPDNTFLKGLVDTAMAQEGNELTLSGASDVNVGAEIALPKATVAGNDVVVSYTSENAGIAKIEDGKIKGVSYGKTNVIATMKGAGENVYTKKISVMVEDSRFANTDTQTLTEQNGARKVEINSYYEKGVGYWIKGKASHDVHVDYAWISDETNFEFWLQGKQFWIAVHNGTPRSYSATNGEGTGFDLTRTTIWTVSNGEGASTKFTTYMDGFISNETLKGWGVTEAELSKDYYIMSAAFKVKDQTGLSGVVEELGSASGDYWTVCQSQLVFADGQVFDPADVKKGETFNLPVVGATTKGFSYNATLNEYGLLIYAEAKTDTATADSALRIQFVMSNGTQMGEQTYLKADSNATASWIRRWGVTATEGSGYARTIKFEIFLDWTKLQGNFYNNNSNANDDKLYGINVENMIESTIYIVAAFEGTDQLTFKYKNINVTTNTYTLTQLDSQTIWQEASYWSGTTQTYNYVTKNGLTVRN